MQAIGFFDFDCTLVHENSLRLFFRELAGRASSSRRCLSLAAVKAMAGEGMRAGIKRHLYRELLRGRTAEEVLEAAQRTAARLTPNRAVVEAFEALVASGGDAVIATASPRIVVTRCLEVLGIVPHLVLGTELGEIGGRLTGELLGGECLGPVKAVKVRGYLAERGPFGSTTGFGNLPDDLAMLELVQQRFVVGRGGVVTSMMCVRRTRRWRFR